jgi:hypothetical protein
MSNTRPRKVQDNFFLSVLRLEMLIDKLTLFSLPSYLIKKKKKKGKLPEDAQKHMNMLEPVI